MPVKGPRLYPMTVVPVRRYARVRAALFVAGLLLVTGLAAWEAGRYALRISIGGADGVGLASRVEELAAENALLRDELAVHRVGGDVARQVEERVREENRGLQDRIAELEQAIAHYRKAILPDSGGKGLRIERLEIVAGGQPGLWRWKLMLLRTGETDGAVEGHLEGRVTYQGSGGSSVAVMIPPETQAFSVRYAREFQGEFRLPEGVSPLRASVAAVITAPRADRVERNWGRAAAPQRTQEVSTNAGQG